MNPGWALVGLGLCAAGAFLDPAAACFGAAGAAVLVIARLNHTLGLILRLSIEVVRSFTYQRDDVIERLQELSTAMIFWRKI